MLPPTSSCPSLAPHSIATTVAAQRLGGRHLHREADMRSRKYVGNSNTATTNPALTLHALDILGNTRHRKVVLPTLHPAHDPVPFVDAEASVLQLIAQQPQVSKRQSKIPMSIYVDFVFHACAHLYSAKYKFADAVPVAGEVRTKLAGTADMAYIAVTSTLARPADAEPCVCRKWKHTRGVVAETNPDNTKRSKSQELRAGSNEDTLIFKRPTSEQFRQYQKVFSSKGHPHQLKLRIANVRLQATRAKPRPILDTQDGQNSKSCVQANEDVLQMERIK
ncbi:hypothetical protein B0H11DRAFT_1919984 [Mycena galericulata]|nr:hypothetical protein B0H11DRAFT_1919984 [Mycena galericulata]